MIQFSGMPEDYEQVNNHHHHTATKWLLFVAILVAGLLIWLINNGSNQSPIESEVLSDEEKRAMQEAELDRLSASAEAQGYLTSTTTMVKQKQELDKIKSENGDSSRSAEEQESELDKIKEEMSGS